MNNNQGRRRTRRVRQLRKQKNTQISRILLTICMIALVAVVSIGGTIAWLQDKTQTVTNTFTTSNVDIVLTETTGNEYKMVPGNTITKDPKVYVIPGSESSWVFVKLEKSENYGTYLAAYQMAEGWNQLKNGEALVEGVFYREYTATTEETAYQVLSGDALTVLTSVTQEQMTEANTNKPTLTITAYAIQKANLADAYTAWTNVQNETKEYGQKTITSTQPDDEGSEG